MRGFSAWPALFVLAAALAARDASADDAVDEARQRFAEGTELVRVAKYGDALAKFEASAALRPHAITLYNVGFCERALGRYTRARAALREALARNAQSAGELPDALASEAKINLDEIEHVLAHVQVTLEPQDARLAVDGRPLAPEGPASPLALLVAGVLPPEPGGDGKAAPAREFEIILDPGPHLITVTHEGFDKLLINESLAPGERRVLPLVMSQQPATLHVRAGQTLAVVTLDGRDVGLAPVDLRRPAGYYQLDVAKDGFVSFHERIAVRPGQELDVIAPLPKEHTSVLTRWWFWTAAGALVAGAAITTYALTRPSPTEIRPAPDGGGLGWAVPLR